MVSNASRRVPRTVRIGQLLIGLGLVALVVAGIFFREADPGRYVIPWPQEPVTAPAPVDVPTGMPFTIATESIAMVCQRPLPEAPPDGYRFATDDGVEIELQTGAPEPGGQERTGEKGSVSGGLIGVAVLPPGRWRLLAPEHSEETDVRVLLTNGDALMAGWVGPLATATVRFVVLTACGTAACVAAVLGILCTVVGVVLLVSGASKGRDGDAAPEVLRASAE
jgi:hypothetical protein